jgi:hypothetical protein
MSYKTDADTEDSSRPEDVWEEPRVTKRSAALTLEGKPVVDAATGETDPGQDLLNEYAHLAGCDADALIRIVDPYGHAMEAYYNVTSTEVSADADGSEVSWDLSMVGESEGLPYIQVSGISIVSLGEEPETITMDINDAPRLILVSFSPENASNKRYSIRAGGKAIRVGNISDAGFTVKPLKVGVSTVTITSLNNGKTDTVTIAVTNESQPFITGVLGVGMLGAMVLGRSGVSA